MTSRRSVWSARALAGILGVGGTAHFVVPAPYASIVPSMLGDPYPWVYVSGVAELACAAGLLLARMRRPAAFATAALFVAVFPANVQMALDAGDKSGIYRGVVYARLPLQVPLVLWALAVARASARRRQRDAT